MMDINHIIGDVPRPRSSYGAQRLGATRFMVVVGGRTVRCPNRIATRKSAIPSLVPAGRDPPVLLPRDPA